MLTEKVIFIFIFFGQAFIEEWYRRSKWLLLLLSPNCYLLFVICTAKKSFLETVNCQLSTVNCNAWDWWHEHVSVSLSVSFSPHVICNHVTFCKHVCKICYLLFVICTAKKSFLETVNCNAWCWCHWPVPVTFWLAELPILWTKRMSSSRLTSWLIKA